MIIRRHPSFGKCICTLGLCFVLAWLIRGTANSAEVGPSVEVYSSGSGGGDSSGGESGGLVPRWRLPVHFAVSLGAGYDENASTTTDGEGSVFTNASINANYEFGTERTRASLSTGTGLTYYPDLGGNQYDPNLYFNLTVNHQVSLRLTLNALVSVRYAAEPDFANNITLDRRAGNYFTTSDNLSASYQWLPRLSTVSSYGFATVLYDDRATADAQNRVDHSFSQSFRFLYLPVTTLVATYSLSAAVYDGSDRDSYTQAVLVGLDHTFSEKLTGNIRGGIEFRTTSNSALQANDGANPHFEAGLNYAVGGKTSISWNASYATQESYVPLSSGSLTFRTGLLGTYAITPRLNSNIAVNYQHNDNGGIQLAPGIDTSFNEDSIDVSLGMSYLINRFISASVSYDHTEVQSDLSDRGYSRNRYSGSLGINF